jgi:hypothetical protein
MDGRRISRLFGHDVGGERLLEVAPPGVSAGAWKLGINRFWPIAGRTPQQRFLASY